MAYRKEWYIAGGGGILERGKVNCRGDGILHLGVWLYCRPGVVYCRGGWYIAPGGDGILHQGGWYIAPGGGYIAGGDGILHQGQGDYIAGVVVYCRGGWYISPGTGWLYFRGGGILQ